MPELALKLGANALILLIAVIGWGLENRWHDRRTKTRRRWARVLIGLVMAVSGVDSVMTWRTHGQQLEQQEQAARIEEGVQTLVELAREGDPTLSEDAALGHLREEIEELRRIAAKHEFTPLVPKLRAEFVARIREFAPEFVGADSLCASPMRLGVHLLRGNSPRNSPDCCEKGDSRLRVRKRSRTSS